MVRDPAAPSTSSAALALGAAVVFLAGIGVGLLIGGEAPGSPGTSGGEGAVVSAVGALGHELDGLRQDLARLGAPRLQPVESAEPLEADVPWDGAELASRDDVAEVLERIEQLEELQRQLLVMEGTASPAGGAPAVDSLADMRPWSMPARDYLHTLKAYSNDGGEDHITRSHLMWEGARVREAYGEPDRIEDRGDYVEWIYDFSEDGDQFDFHFVNGLVTRAH